MDFAVINEFLKDLRWDLRKNMDDPKQFRDPENWYLTVHMFEYLQLPLEQEHYQLLFLNGMDIPSLAFVDENGKVTTLTFSTPPKLIDILEKINELKLPSLGNYFWTSLVFQSKVC